ncbi:MAG TPA: ABC transporter ATP-binding protein [Mycobacteriales bacterium]|jgi:peptide/nickel transport system ATP-binding protein|nr:ABC transporter ATP-binding protein [Mycobacteriales bacterium]
MSESLMRLEHVSQTFATKQGNVPAVDDVSLELRSGRVTCLVGESGSGKTTTARIAAGLNAPTSGRVLFDGNDVAQLSGAELAAYRLAVQYIHQDPYASLNPTRTVQSTLTAPLRRNHLVKGRAGANRRAAELLAEVDLTPAGNYLSKYPHQLSGGQRQRASLARALSTNPRLIVADEATSMLDVSIRISMLNVLGRLRDTLSVGFLFITHDLALAKYFGWSGDLAVMYLGRIVEQGPTPEVLAHPSHPYTRALLEAIPEPDPDLTRSKQGGQLRDADMPNLLAIPKGCPFHPRCPMYEAETCDTTRPDLLATRTDGDTDHLAACLRLSAVDAELPLTSSVTDGGLT